MGDKSQPAFLMNALVGAGYHQNSSPKTALNTGSISKNFGADYQFIEQWKTRIEGCDIEAGPNVDHVFDLTKEPPEYLIDRYDLIITSSTLEHVTEPWKAAECLEKMLRTGGYIYISVPWVWRYHAYPDDYWRFNSHTLELLFKSSSLVTQAWSTSPDCTLHPYSDSLDNDMSMFHKSHRRQSPVGRIFSRIQEKFRGRNDSVKYLPYLMIHQLRQKSP